VNGLLLLEVGRRYPMPERYALGRAIDDYRKTCSACKQVTPHETLATETTDGRPAEVEACASCGLIEKGSTL
jgi:hypothetical protein